MSNSETLQQAAVVLKCLPKGEAAQIMSKLDAAEIREVIQESESIGDLSREAVLSALNQLSLEAASFKTDRKDERRRLNGRLREGAGFESEAGSGPFHFLAHLSAELRAELMADEHPENVALVMMYLPSELGSEMLRRLDSAMQVSTVRRLCEFEEVVESQILQLAINLKLRLQKKLQRTKKPAGVQLAGQLLSCSDEGTREKVLAYINQLDPVLVNDLERSIFRFEDLRHLENQDVQVLLRNVDTSFWAPALKAASSKVREKVLGNMAPRVVQLLSQEIEQIHELDPKISQHAQLEIVNACVQLNESGKIDLPIQLTGKKNTGHK